MEWDGRERRSGYVSMGSDIIDIKTDLAVVKTDVKNLDKRINGSVEEIEKHMSRSASWRTAIVALILSVVTQIITFAYLWGNATRQITINAERVKIMEDKMDKVKDSMGLTYQRK